MPGPLSAPNGETKLTLMKGEQRVALAQAKKLATGKTEKKKRRDD